MSLQGFFVALRVTSQLPCHPARFHSLSTPVYSPQLFLFISQTATFSRLDCSSVFLPLKYFHLFRKGVSHQFFKHFALSSSCFCGHCPSWRQERAQPMPGSSPQALGFFEEQKCYSLWKEHSAIKHHVL